VHLHTADARYDLSAVLNGFGSRAGDGELLAGGGWFESGVLTSSELLERFGIDVAGSGADCVNLSLSQSTNFHDNRLHVWGGSCDLNAKVSNWVEVLKLAE
jgi:hypothetical protein